ncbi:MarR family transcriptional regulator [Streptomyces cinnamoneus]|uniref:MarR family winged helix-turn-helix transcriptional regulator n=1 Tax=Streptomyces cinnamoneus TaxID=53446 RepID=UPI003407FD9B
MAKDAEDAEDIVARVLRQWQQVHPGLDTAPMAVIGRLNRCAALLQQASDAPLVREGLSRAEFDILGTLRRTGRELTPGQIARETFASGAAVTKRLRVLEGRELVARRADDRDRRVAHLSLTPAGEELIDRLIPLQLSYEQALLAGLGGDRQTELADILAELLVLLEGRLGGLQP